MLSYMSDHPSYAIAPANNSKVHMRQLPDQYRPLRPAQTILAIPPCGKKTAMYLCLATGALSGSVIHGGMIVSSMLSCMQ